MGNYTGKINLIKIKVNIKNPKEGLENIIDSLDSDYEKYSGRIVDNIIKRCEENKRDVIDMIDSVLNCYQWEVMEYSEEFKEDINVLEDVSNFFLQNDTYCSGFESEIVNCDDHELVIITYGS